MTGSRSLPRGLPQFQVGGGGTPVQGTLQPGQGWGTPQPGMGVTHPPLARDGDRTTGGVLATRRRYASCVHSEGLSCLITFLTWILVLSRGGLPKSATDVGKFYTTGYPLSVLKWMDPHRIICKYIFKVADPEIG